MHTTFYTKYLMVHQAIRQHSWGSPKVDTILGFWNYRPDFFAVTIEYTEKHKRCCQTNSAAPWTRNGQKIHAVFFRSFWTSYNKIWNSMYLWQILNPYSRNISNLIIS